ncbi:MAG: hypothetical protein HYZ37_03555 [Candidatus Solibacter usitatus]|nr:hypothetical protein [Candidatus Solibacter usitatus]
MPQHRREWLENCIVRGLLVAGVPMSQSKLFGLWQEGQSKAQKPTPAEVLGPFFKKGAPNTRAMRKPGAPGFPMHVTGKVLNTKGEPVRNATVDVWHSDHEGLYDVQGYKYRAKLVLDSATEYAMDTIMPGHYPDRPAQHIHYLIAAPGYKTLITQLYFATDPWFEGDVEKNYKKRNLVENRELVRPVQLFEKGAPHAAVTFDICLEKA